MRNLATLVFAALFSCAASWALASGREVEQCVEAVRIIVAVVLIAFAASMTTGVVVSAVEARRSGELALKGSAFGVLMGLRYFLVVSAVTIVIVTVLSFLWIVCACVVTWLLDNP